MSMKLKAKSAPKMQLTSNAKMPKKVATAKAAHITQTAVKVESVKEVKLIPLTRKDMIANSAKIGETHFKDHQNIPTFDEKLGVVALLKPCATTKIMLSLYEAGGEGYDSEGFAAKLSRRTRTKEAFGQITKLTSAKMGLTSNNEAALLIDATWAKAQS